MYRIKFMCSAPRLKQRSYSESNLQSHKIIFITSLEKIGKYIKILLSESKGRMAHTEGRYVVMFCMPTCN